MRLFDFKTACMCACVHICVCTQIIMRVMQIQPKYGGTVDWWTEFSVLFINLIDKVKINIDINCCRPLKIYYASNF